MVASTQSPPRRASLSTEPPYPAGRLAAGVVGVFGSTAILTLLAWALLPAVIGWRPFVVTSSSMAPALEVGDVVVVAPHTGAGLEVGTVITFDAGNGAITHRIIEARGEGSYVTRGDAVATSDSSPVVASQVIGIGRLVVPYVGLPYAWLHQGYRLAAFGAVVGVLALAYASRLAEPPR